METEVEAPVAEEQKTPTSAPLIGNLPFPLFEADKQITDKDFKKGILEGHVIVAGGGVIFTADKVAYESERKRFTASGHVIVITPKSVFYGEDLRFYYETGDFRITKSEMFAFDQERIDRVSREILGLTPEELRYETGRAEQLKNLEKEKGEVRTDYRSQVLAGKQDTARIESDYAQLLQKDQLIRDHMSPTFSRLSEDKRESFKRRRTVWEEGMKRAQTQGKSGREFYFKMKGDEIERTNGNDYRAQEATWTPCHCEDDEAPVWAFRSERINAQVEGYVDMQHPVLMIKGFPIIYLPFLKVPLKQTRQSGFLMPNFTTGEKRSGSLVTQPIFFAFSDASDATLTTDWIEKRGTRLGVEMRHESKQYSGWTLNLETIRDREWNAERENRQIYFDRLITPGSPDTYCEGRTNDPQCTEGYWRDSLHVPSNTWRGTQEWRGMTFLAPRLSIVSRGKVRSDHQYAEDLLISNRIEDAFQPAQNASSTELARAALHLDGKSFYLGLFTGYADSVLASSRFYGYQRPLHVRLQTRYYLLNDKNSRLPVYVSVQGQSSQIRTYFNELPAMDLEPTNPSIELGAGQWNRVATRLVTPLLREGVFRSDFFSEFEARGIEHQGFSDKTSSIRSYVVGLTLHLPIDGSMRLPDSWQNEDSRDPFYGSWYGHHMMDWSMTFSARPTVIRRGPYGEKVSITGPDGAVTNTLDGDLFVYQASDRKTFVTGDDAVSVEESMQQHQRVTFATDHRWRFERRGLALLESKGEEVAKKDAAPHHETWLERARRELKAGLDQALPDPKKAFDAQGEPLFKRYQPKDLEIIEPVAFSSSITYDFVQAKLRNQALAEKTRLQEAGADPGQLYAEPNLPHPWTGPYANLTVAYGGYSLSNSLKYNTYLRSVEEMRFALGVPAVFKTSFAYVYGLGRSPVVTGNADNFKFEEKTTHAITADSQIIPMISLRALYLRNITPDNVDPNLRDTYETSYGATYVSPSDCWGLQFLRQKKHNEKEQEASYILQFSMIFMGQTRALGDIAPAAERAVDREGYERRNKS